MQLSRRITSTLLAKMIDLDSISKIIQSGGSAALLTCIYFMWRLNDRLTRIELAINLIAAKSGIKYSDVLKGGDK